MGARKVRIVLVSHGEQCKGMLNTVQMLLGPQENIAAQDLQKNKYYSYNFQW